MGRTLALFALAVLAGWSGCQRAGEQDREVSFPDFEPGQTEFRDTSELLRAIERGTFAEQVAQEIPEAVVPESVALRFVSGTSLPDAELPKLRELAAALKADTRIRVDLVGCSDPPGSESLNQRISQARAEAVASGLDELGVPAAQIGEVVGRGEDCKVQERAVFATPYAAKEALEPGSQQES